ncbi:methyl-accepting chemotaxis protein [Arcobacter sp. F2176]|uniref:methyl-accepting chemotaxis protein n=1 Tax=Arcobacter sp. F2176 TaxID=2044511 RepID=UPI00100C2C9A|nr:cache domain-containing protein [Arcobacter sp. F2176]RXJ82461.1 chemotaxis protein [Arcobacter sp. F2176]
MKNLSIKSKLLLIIIFTIIIVAGLIAVKSIYSLNELTKENIATYKKNAYEEQEKELKSYVDFARNVAVEYYKKSDINIIKENIKKDLEGQMNFLFFMLEDLYKKFNGKVSDEELKRILLDAVGSARYGTNNGYFFVYNEDAIVLKHPINQAKEGKRYPKPHILNFIDLAIKNGQGLVSYEQTVPNKPPREKVAFVKLFKPYKWVIGTGSYLDNITEKLQAEALSTIKAMRYGKNNNGYFFIYDYDGNNVMHPIKPQNVGKNFMKSAHIRDLISLAKKDGGLVKYNFIKPNDKKLYEKLGYGIGFDEWKWMIGTGAYTDEIEANINKMQKESDEKIQSIVFGILLIALIVSFIVGLFVVYFINKQITNPLSTFQNGLLNFFSYLNKETSAVEKIVISNKDEIGTMANIVNINIEKTQQLIEEDEKVIENVKDVVMAVNSGNLSTRVTQKTENQGLEELKNIFNEMIDSISSKINNNLNDIDSALNELKNMNFTHRIKNPNGKVAIALNSLADTINEMLVNNMNNGLNLQSSAKELLKNVAILNTASNESAASLEETAAAIEEITSNIASSAENILQMVSFANKVSKSAIDGENLANKTTISMDSINNEVIAISEAITVVDQIAFQTNILSLNAAVEAATAGEAGKGFAVVAAEVRNLASRSADAAKEIKELVEKATVKANEGKNISNQMINGYAELKENITQTLGLISNVEISSKEQRMGIEQINDAVATLDQQTQKNASVANLSNEIAEETQKIAGKILEEVEEKDFIGKK